MKKRLIFLLMTAVVLFTACSKDDNLGIEGEIDNLPDITGYPIVGTNQSTSFDNTTEISKPSAGQDFYGQNSNFPGTTPKYEDNGDGTVTDMVSGLMWQNTLDHNGDGSIDINDKLTYDEILAMVDTDSTGGHTDWRLPTIKEQYSLIMFSGRDISGYEGSSTQDLIPFINTGYFAFYYGDTNAGERLIDVQCASTNVSVGNAMEMVFGVNFADGRIKGYGTTMMGQAKVFNYLLVRGNESYGLNSFTDNGDGTVTDAATGLMWMQDDSGFGMNWKDALKYAENFSYAGHSDWRLPDAKELQSIVDYSRSPQTTASAAIDPVFKSTSIINEAGEQDYPYIWSSTTHANMTEGNEGAWGAYISFGRAIGNESEMGMSQGVEVMLPPSDGMLPPADTLLPTDGNLPPPNGGDGTLAPPNGGDGTLAPPNRGDGTLAPPNGGVGTNIMWTDVHGAGAQRSDPKTGDASEFPMGNGPQGDAVRVLNYVRLVRNN